MGSQQQQQQQRRWQNPPHQGAALLAAARLAASGAAAPSWLCAQQLQGSGRLHAGGPMRFSLQQCGGGGGGSGGNARGRAAAPFASVSSIAAGRRLPGANPLFLLGRLADPGSSLSEGGSSAAASGTSSSSGGEAGAASSSGYESDSGDTSDLQLDKIQCQLCRKPLSQRGGRRGLFGRRRGGGSGGGPFLVCDGCQRSYHEQCCRDKGISTREDKQRRWFHSAGCRECLNGLQQQASRGASELPGGRTWQLVDCTPRSATREGGLQALRSLKQSLGEVLDVLLPSYGPGVAQQLVDAAQGYAVLLRQGQQPVSAGLLDVYGQEVAVLDLVATQMEHQGRGHCTAMVGALEGFLGPTLGVASLVAVCPADEPETVRAWQRKFGFRRLEGRQLRRLADSIPPLGLYDESVLLSKPLEKQRKQQQQQQKHKRPEEPAAEQQQQQQAAEGDAAKAQR